MKRVITHGMIALLLAFLLVMAGSVQAQDAGQDDDEAPGIGELTPGDRESDEFRGDIAGRLYTFLASEGDTVTIRMIQAERSTLDPYLVLMDEFGAVLVSDDDGYQSVNLAAEITDYEIEDNGRYFVLATGYNFLHQQPELDSESGDDMEIVPLEYTIEIAGATMPPEDEVFAPLENMREASNGDEFTVEIDSIFPVSFAVIEAEAGDTLSVSTTSDETDTLLMIFGPEGERVIVNDDRAPGDLSSEVRGLQIDRDGSYIIMVTVYDFEFAYDAGWASGGAVEVAITLE